ncbi:hypothetical protein GCM10027446_08530 [Angustibacter peucedani]
MTTTDPAFAVDVPALDLQPIALEPRETRSDDRPDDVPGSVLLGGPFWTELPADYAKDDADTEAFREDGGSRWLLGVLALSLHLDHASERFERAWLDLTMTRDDGLTPDAVAWSMKPDRVASEVSRSTKVSLGPKLTIADVGIDASVERGTERTMQEVSVDALNEKTSKPRWVLKRTGSADLDGCTRLAVVVRAPLDVAVKTTIDVGYVTARRKAVFFWPRTDHQQARQNGSLPQ